MTDFRVQVARLFFSLSEAAGFLLAGGAGLVAQHLTTRPTQDLDFFTRVGGTGVPAARDALEAAAHGRGWTIEKVREEGTFCRLVNGFGNAELARFELPAAEPRRAVLISRLRRGAAGWELAALGSYVDGGFDAVVAAAAQG